MSGDISFTISVVDFSSKRSTLKNEYRLLALWSRSSSVLFIDVRSLAYVSLSRLNTFAEVSFKSFLITALPINPAPPVTRIFDPLNFQ